MANLYEAIKEACELKGTNVSRMCQDLGMSKSVISDLKAGRKKGLSTETLAKVSEYLDTSSDKLLGIEKSPSPTRGDELIEILDACKERSDLRALFMLAKDTPPDEIKKTISILKAWKND